METKQFRLGGYGDVLDIDWDGNCWVAPCCGAPFSDENGALKCELTAYLRACGEAVDPDTLDPSEYGEWTA
jgi:hypothetical protein